MAKKKPAAKKATTKKTTVKKKPATKKAATKKAKMNSYDSTDANTERPNIAEKVRCWEEQDKINQALIPRVKELHEIVTDLHKRTPTLAAKSPRPRRVYSKRYKSKTNSGSNRFAIEISAGVEGALPSLLLDTQDVPDVDPDIVHDAVPDDLFEAYRLAFPDVAENYSLRERYLEMVEKGQESVKGFISNIKGKLAELSIQEQLAQEFPDYFFTIAENPNQPAWDIFGTTIYDGTNVVLIQAKMGGEEYAGEVLTRMQKGVVWCID